MAAPPRPVSELASLVEKHTRALEDSLKGTPGAAFSLALGAPALVKVPAEMEATRAELIETIDELRARILGPMGYLTAVTLPVSALIIVLHTLYSCDVPARVPLDGSSITYADLASSSGSGLGEDDARRVLQTAISFRIFEEAVPGVSVRHNAVSAVFAALPGMRDFLGLVAEEQVPAACAFVASLRQFPGSGEPGHSALMVALRAQQQQQRQEKEAGVDVQDPDPSKGLFDFIADDEARVARFRSAMGMAAHTPAFAHTHFVDNLPWSSSSGGGGGAACCPETVVDIGGAGGDLCQLMLRTHAGVRRAVSLDLPEVVAGAQAPADLEGRLEYGAYNFLTEKMAREADAYVFRHIFHDWSDQYAARILGNLVPALKPGRSRVWLSEVVLPDLGCHTRDQLQRSADLHMKAGFNGKERSKRDWESLFAQVDKRFRIVNITQPDGAHDAVIEVAFDA
ncbi:S-adenosyl-L-methionine-dependent methyltransferase [Biscogniauxia sp. FL1348]|nr:S-adenosyl-L-methionine-dependent methyltransferase [Biscogniauxia sp. FL1348]